MTLNETTLPAELLRTLHRIHRQLADLDDRRGRGPRLLRAQEANLEKAREQAAAAQAEARRLLQESKRKQDAVAAAEQRLEKRRQQLQEAKDNREYQALKEQIAADQMANSVLADEALELMEQCDAFQAKVAEAEALHRDCQTKLDAARRRIEDELPTIEADIQRVQAELVESEKALPAEFRDLYRRSVRDRGADALAGIEEQYCNGCNQQVPLNAINSLLLQKPITCRTCGRLLYLPENYKQR